MPRTIWYTPSAVKLLALISLNQSRANLVKSVKFQIQRKPHSEISHDHEDSDEEEEDSNSDGDTFAIDAEEEEEEERRTSGNLRRKSPTMPTSPELAVINWLELCPQATSVVILMGKRWSVDCCRAAIARGQGRLKELEVDWVDWETLATLSDDAPLLSLSIGSLLDRTEPTKIPELPWELQTLSLHAFQSTDTFLLQSSSLHLLRRVSINLTALPAFFSSPHRNLKYLTLDSHDYIPDDELDRTLPFWCNFYKSKKLEVVSFRGRRFPPRFEQSFLGSEGMIYRSSGLKLRRLEFFDWIPIGSLVDRLEHDLNPIPEIGVMVHANTRIRCAALIGLCEVTKVRLIWLFPVSPFFFRSYPFQENMSS
jgi:hypothetical protein